MTPASDDDRELQGEDHIWKLETLLRSEPKLMRKWKPKFKYLETVATNTARIHELAALWSDRVPQSVLLEFNTEASASFIKLCIGLTKRKSQCVPMSLCMWWRRMVATGNQHVLTYFSWAALERLQLDTVMGSDILRACTDNMELLKNITDALDDDKSVDFRIRELLGGLGSNSDVRKAWKNWCMTNHPDKSGDPEKFLEVKIVYDEWCELQKRKAANEEAKASDT